MYNWCSTPFFIVSLLNWSKQCLTAFDFILATANVFGFSSAVTAWEFGLSAAPLPFSQVLLAQKWRQHLKDWLSSLSPSPIIGSIAQLIFCASCLRSSGIFYYWGTDLQPHRLMNMKLLQLHHYQPHSCLNYQCMKYWMDGSSVHLWPCWNGLFSTCWQNWTMPAH